MRSRASVSCSPDRAIGGSRLSVSGLSLNATTVDQPPITRVPVVFVVYNRLDTTARVFARIADARPETLLIVADGPRAGQEEDSERCRAVRELVSRPHWNCDVRLNCAPSNMGFNRRISSGLAWAFEQFEEVIVLEDDCLPEPSFFPFCVELLERFRFDENVMMITGDNFQFGRKRGEGSYYFSQSVGTWGWAGWRRAFQHFDREMREWPAERRNNMLSRVWPVPSLVEHWRARFDEAHRGEVDAWDYQWAFAMWRRMGLQVAPGVNLIRYIGCRPDSAHTSDPQAPFCEVPTFPMRFPLVHPPVMQRDLTADLFECYRVILNEEDSVAEAHSTEAARLPGPPK